MLLHKRWPRNTQGYEPSLISEEARSKEAWLRLKPSICKQVCVIFVEESRFPSVFVIRNHVTGLYVLLHPAADGKYHSHNFNSGGESNNIITCTKLHLSSENVRWRTNVTCGAAQWHSIVTFFGICQKYLYSSTLFLPPYTTSCSVLSCRHSHVQTGELLWRK